MKFFAVFAFLVVLIGSTISFIVRNTNEPVPIMPKGTKYKITLYPAGGFRINEYKIDSLPNDQGYGIRFQANGKMVITNHPFVLEEQ